MSSADTLCIDIKRLIVDTLMLEDLSPDDIDTDAPLFNEGLGLDSIDALDLAMALDARYGVQSETDAIENRRRFASVRALADFVQVNRTR